MAQKMYSRQEVEALGVDGVVEFAKGHGLNETALQVLKDGEIDGSVLERMTVEKLMADGMKRGPAEKLMIALDNVFGRGMQQTKKSKKKGTKKLKKKGVRKQERVEALANRTLHVLLYHLNTGRAVTLALSAEQQFGLHQAMYADGPSSSACMSSSSMKQGRTNTKYRLVLGVTTDPVGIAILEETKSDGTRQFVYVRYQNKTYVPVVSWTTYEVEEEKEQATDPIAEMVKNDLEERIAWLEEELTKAKIEKDIKRFQDEFDQLRAIRNYFHSGEATAWITTHFLTLAQGMIQRV